jgi:hypothetical protein
MSALEGPFAAACVLLVVAGAYKLTRPIPTAGALAALDWPSSLPAVRMLGAGELALGAAALVTSNRALAALVAAAYTSFAAFVVVALRADTPIQSCGCFGETTTPPSIIHVLTNLAFVAVAVAVALGGLPSAADALADQPWAGVPFALLVAITVQLVYALLTDLPRALHRVEGG